MNGKNTRGSSLAYFLDALIICQAFVHLLLKCVHRQLSSAQSLWKQLTELLRIIQSNGDLFLEINVVEFSFKSRFFTTTKAKHESQTYFCVRVSAA